MIILLRVLNKVLGFYIGVTFEIEKEDVLKEKYSFETRARELVEIVEKHRTENSWLQ